MLWKLKMVAIGFVSTTLMDVLFALWLLYNLNDNAEVAHNVPN
jgi:hypothetical protein